MISTPLSYLSVVCIGWRKSKLEMYQISRHGHARYFGWLLLVLPDIRVWSRWIPQELGEVQPRSSSSQHSHSLYWWRILPPPHSYNCRDQIATQCRLKKQGVPGQSGIELQYSNLHNILYYHFDMIYSHFHVPDTGIRFFCPDYVFFKKFMFGICINGLSGKFLSRKRFLPVSPISDHYLFKKYSLNSPYKNPQSNSFLEFNIVYFSRMSGPDPYSNCNERCIMHIPEIFLC